MEDGWHGTPFRGMDDCTSRGRMVRRQPSDPGVLGGPVGSVRDDVVHSLVVRRDLHHVVEGRELGGAQRLPWTDQGRIRGDLLHHLLLNSRDHVQVERHLVVYLNPLEDPQGIDRLCLQELSHVQPLHKMHEPV